MLLRICCILLTLLCGGCLYFQYPAGDSLPAEDIPRIDGIWYGLEDGESGSGTVHIYFIPEGSFLVIILDTEGTVEDILLAEIRFLNGLYLVNLRMHDDQMRPSSPGYYVARMEFFSDKLCFYLFHTEFFKTLVKNGSLRGRIDDNRTIITASTPELKALLTQSSPEEYLNMSDPFILIKSPANKR